MEQTNKKLNLILTVAVVVLILAFIAAMTMPLITYTRTEPAEVAGQEGTVSLMQYLWVPYNYQDLTTDVIPPVYTAEVGASYNLTNTIVVPLFAFIVAFISIAFAFLLKNKSWSIYFPIIWAVGCLIGYFVDPTLNLSIVNSTTRLVHIIIFALVLIISLIKLIKISIPQMRYERAHRENF